MRYCEDRGEDVGFRRRGCRLGSLGSSFLTDSNFLYLSKFLYLDAKYRANLVLSIFKNELQLPTGVWRLDCICINFAMLHADWYEVCFSIN